MIVETIILEKVSKQIIKELLRVLKIYYLKLTDPTLENMLKFSIALKICKMLNKKERNETKKQKLKFSLHEAIILIEVIAVAENEEKTSMLHLIKNNIHQQLPSLNQN